MTPAIYREFFILLFRASVQIIRLRLSGLKSIMADQEPTKGDPKLEDTVDQMHSSDETEKLNAFRVVRKMTQAKNLPMQELLDHGVVPLCVQFLDSKM